MQGVKGFECGNRDVKMRYLAILLILVGNCFGLRTRYTPDKLSVLERRSNVRIIDPTKDVHTELAALVADTNMGTLSNTNRRELFFMPGLYTLTADDDLQLTQYVDLRGSMGSVLFGDNTNGPAVSVPTLSSTETGITTYITNLTIRGTGAGIAQTTAGSATSIVVIQDCAIFGNNDAIHGAGSEMLQYRISGSEITGFFDGIAMLGNNTSAFVEGCDIRMAAANDDNNNTTWISRGLYVALGGSIEAHACYVEVDSQPDAGVVSPQATAVSVEGTGKITAKGITVKSSATQFGGGTADSDGFFMSAAGTLNIVGCHVLSVDDEDIDINAGTCTVSGSIYDSSNSSGTILPVVAGIEGNLVSAQTEWSDATTPVVTGPIMYIKGEIGGSTLTDLTAGLFGGQKVLIVGTSDALWVEFPDSGRLDIGGTIRLSQGDTLFMYYDITRGVWTRIASSDN
jgi:hypothetical protein